MARHAWKGIIGLLAVVIGLLMLGGPAQQQPAKPPPQQQAEPPKSQPRKTVGKTTQTVLDLAVAVAQGGVRVDNASEPEEGGLGAYAQAYRHSVATIGGLAVEQKMKIHQAMHGKAPDTYEEFMETIIAPGTPDGVSLPMLPFYQEYAFDPESKKLVVVEFPAKKEQRRQETTGASGL